MGNQTLCIIVLITVCITALMYLLYMIRKNGLRETVIRLIVVAESMFNHGENKEKMDYVIDQITSYLRPPLSFFITASSIRKFVQSIFDEIKEALDYRG